MSKCLSTTDCQGNTLCSSVAYDSTVRTIQAPEDVMKVCLVNNTEFDHTVMCEIDGTGAPTGVKVNVVTTYSVSGVPTTEYYNLATGLAWAGDPTTELGKCQDSDTEAEVREMCDSGTTFLRWYVLRDGRPTGVTYDTTLTGATYTVVGTASLGSCDSVLIEVNTPDGMTVTGVTSASGYPAEVKSITVSAMVDNVVVTTGSGTMNIREGSSFSWGEGDTNNVDTAALTFNGGAVTSEYILHWEA